MTYILQVSNTTLTLAQKRGNNIVILAQIPLGILTKDALRSSIQRALHPLPEHAPLKLLLTLQEEEIHFTSIPKVLPWEKPALIQLKTRQLINMRESLAYLSVELPPPHPHDKEKQLRILNLISTPLLQTLFEELEQRVNPCTGVYSTRLLLENAFKRRLNNTPHLVILDDADHLNLQVYINHHLYLDRFIQKPEPQAQQLETLIHELSLTIRYFYNERILPIETPFEFSHLYIQKQKSYTPEQLQAALQQLSQQHTWLTPEACPSLSLCDFLNLTPQQDFTHCTLSLLHKKPCISYPLPHVRLARTLTWGSTLLKLTTASILIAVLFTLAFILAQQHALRHQLIPQIEQQLAQLQQHYTTIKQQWKILNKTNLEDFVPIYRQAQQLLSDIKATQPIKPLTQFTKKVAEFSRIRINSLSMGKIQPDQQNNAQNTAQPTTSQKTKEASNPKTPSTENKAHYRLPHELHISADVTLYQPFATYQQNIHYIRQLQSTLQALPQVKNVMFDKMPIALSDQQPLTLDYTKLMPSELTFELKVDYRMESPKQ